MTERWVLVCGGRDFYDRNYMNEIMNSLHNEHLFTMLIHGDTHGADRLAGQWAKANGIQEIKVPANWNGEGKAAGFLRNQLMLDLFEPDVVVAFPGGRGTEDMISRAHYTTKSLVITVP